MGWVVKRVFEKPVTTEEGPPFGGTVTTHPAFGQIVAHRTQGSRVLYGSDIDAPGFVTVTITRSEMRRSLSRDWFHPRDELIQVSMTEAQWAAFVSGMNIGSGPCCTIQSIRNEYVPELPEREESKTALFEKEIRESVTKLAERVAALASKLDGPLPKTKVAELRRELENVASHIAGNVTFVGDQFTEHMENEVERAKMEVNAYVTSTLMRAGIDSLSKGSLTDCTVIDTKALPEHKE